MGAEGGKELGVEGGRIFWRVSWVGSIIVICGAWGFGAVILLRYSLVRQFVVLLYYKQSGLLRCFLVRQYMLLLHHKPSGFAMMFLVRQYMLLLQHKGSLVATIMCLKPD